ncbi:hypothetical protein T01_2189 [Trichinella spiralis]|uniref:Uncharacterized protein n=1 Tax=Trichinella spiralis TaxID=6334 RepID=A0A0V1AWK6_TRISP|nr:hypothetical protein T01_2189 [Trichinella spiralis]
MSVNDFNSSMVPLNYISKLNLTKGGEEGSEMKCLRCFGNITCIFFLRAAIFSIDLSKNFYQ